MTFLTEMLIAFMLLVGATTLSAAEPIGASVAPSREAGRRLLPPITHPVMFNTPEVDRIVEALQVFPPDNPWNEDISRWPVRTNSQNIIASIGAEKPLRYNPDMAFILVPPNQRGVSVKILSYPGESDNK